MNISSSGVSFANQSSAVQSRPQGSSPKQGKQQLSGALQSIGVDQSTTSAVLTQIDEAISVLEAESSTGNTSRDAVQPAIDGVLKANGIDPAEVGEAIQANGPTRSGRPAGSGRPNGPPPPPRQDDSESSTLESALLSAGVDESSTADLINQIIESIQALTSDESSNASTDDLQSALSSVLEANGVEPEAFEQAIADQVDTIGLFLDRLV